MKTIDRSPSFDLATDLSSFHATLKARSDCHPDGAENAVIAIDRLSGTLLVRIPSSDAPGFDELRLYVAMMGGTTVLNSRTTHRAAPNATGGDTEDGRIITRMETIETLALPFASTRLIDIHLAQEGNAFYVYLLLGDGSHPGAAGARTGYRFRLVPGSCHQLDEASGAPEAHPVDQFLAPDTCTESPELRQSSDVLPWPAAALLLMTVAAAIGWICATAGQSTEDVGATVMATTFLLATLPFFCRRAGGFTLAGLLKVSAAGILVSLSAFLFKTDIVVIPVLIVGALLPTVFRTNEYGRIKLALIDIEKRQPAASKLMATRTEQEQNTLWIVDFFVVLFLFCILACAYSGLKAWTN